MLVLVTSVGNGKSVLTLGVGTGNPDAATLDMSCTAVLGVSVLFANPFNI